MNEKQTGRVPLAETDVANMRVLQSLVNPIPIISLALDMVDERLGQGTISDEIYEDILTKMVTFLADLDAWRYTLFVATDLPETCDRPHIVDKVREIWPHIPREQMTFVGD